MRFRLGLNSSLRPPIAVCAIWCVLGCAAEHTSQPVVPGSAESPVLATAPADAVAIRVPATAGWVETEVMVRAGDAISITASGKVRTERNLRGHEAEEFTGFGPEGTFLFADAVAAAEFLLPAAARGPAPVYSLIGRIGNGPAFYIGRNRSWFAQHSGRLQLAINDFDHRDNAGAFCAHVQIGQQIRPVTMQERIDVTRQSGGPIPGSRVVVFYIDGLRPDVIREMAAMGHIPQINALFIEGGVEVANTFTAFPSDTITSNGTMWTGCFSDRHGIKGQVRFSRRTLHSASYLDPLGPYRSANTLSPQGWGAVSHESSSTMVGLAAGDDAEARFRQQQVTGVPPIFDYLRASGDDWATGALPMMPAMPPLLWSRSLVRHLPYFHTHEAWKYIDDANTHFAQWQLFDRQAPVTIVWLPETDSVSHKYSRGQFGVTRRTIAEADRLIARMVQQLQETGELQRTYFVLVSDHGHHGGRYQHLAHFDLANQLFFEPRQMSRSGQWIGGGLGVSVRQHRFSNRHRGDAPSEFVFIDGDSDGAARIFLPSHHFRSGQWKGGSRPADLLSYRIDEHLPPVNLVDTMLQAQAVHCATGHAERPIDLVLMKLSEASVLVATADRGMAIIERFCVAGQGWQYRYQVIDQLQALSNGEVTWQEVTQPKIDPLGLLMKFTPAELNVAYNERVWLTMTADTRYPDGVVSLARHMLWQPHLRERERLFAPDLVVTARSGWYFGQESTKGTTHGYPLADAMRATLFLSGPNLHKGARVMEPARLADLTPTLLEMTGTPHASECLDGKPLRSIYDSVGCRGVGCADVSLASLGHPEEMPQREAIFWHDVDLGAWHPLAYTPQPTYRHLPITINQPDCPLDINNVARNILTVPDLNVVRLADTAFHPLIGREIFLPRLERADQLVRWHGTDWVSQAAPIADVSNIGLGDYNMFSLGNLKRMDRGIDWAQHRLRNLNRNVHGDTGNWANRSHDAVDHTVDVSQAVVWETYRMTQRVLMKILDETAINGLENNVDRAINFWRQTPAEVVVP